MHDIRELLSDEIPSLRRYAIALCRDRDQADDLVQDCLLRALNSDDKLRGSNLRAWLFAILHNVFVDKMRRRGREPNLSTIDHIDETSGSSGNQEHAVRLQELKRALVMLPDDQRETVLLVGLEGMTYEQVAEVTGVAIGTVRSRLSRGRERLRQLLGGEGAAILQQVPLERRSHE